MGLVFVAATGTDIGKTYITSLLVRGLMTRGVPVEALKPVISGFDPEDWAESDSGHLLRAMDVPATEEALNRISPWRFRAALSPDMAAVREGRAVPFDDLVAYTKGAEKSDAVTLVEGVGGVMVPLDDVHTTLDWQQALNATCLLVAGTYLGTISHTLTAAAVLKSKGMMPRALILNASVESPVPAGETAAAIKKSLSDVPIFCVARGASEAPRDLIDMLL